MAYGSRSFGFGFSLTPVVKRLLIANVAAFVLTLLIDQRFVFEWLAFQPEHVLTRPWGAFTYMFLHADVWHLLVNMLVLFFFGSPLEGRWGGREFFRFYVVAGLGGVVLSLLFAPAQMVGASAACYGLMLAFAMNWPNAPIYIYAIFPVKAKWLVGFLFAMSLFGALMSPGGPVAHFAHLGGVLAAFVYLKADWRARSAMDRLRKAAPRKPRRLAIVPRDEDDERAESQSSPSRPAGWSQADERRILDEVDRVLDKISAQGMASLTADERGLLDEVSRRRRMN
jgi:membrane associated rhomboid family serine protease